MTATTRLRQRLLEPRALLELALGLGLASALLLAAGEGRRTLGLPASSWLAAWLALAAGQLLLRLATGVPRYAGRKAWLLPPPEIALTVACGWAQPGLAPLLFAAAAAGLGGLPRVAAAGAASALAIGWALTADAPALALAWPTLASLVASARARREAASLAAAAELSAAQRAGREARQRLRAATRAYAQVSARAAADEVVSWINLTAGLTHSIGNEVLAFDHYAGELKDYLEASQGTPEEVVESARFIHDTNRARLGFINFLQEFAEMMKLSADVRQAPAGLREIDLPAAIHAVRAKVGAFESRELDPDDDDPQIQRQLAKNTSLELIVAAPRPEARLLSSGRRPVLEFIFYEFIKNSLRNCSGKRRLKVALDKVDEEVTIRFINDLDLETKRPDGRIERLRCSRCDARCEELLWLKNSDYLDAFCEGCLRERVAQNLRDCWQPGRTTQGGKGLGLFVIRHFVEGYYFGRARSGILNWETREVFFEVTIPDDLGRAIERYNAALEAGRQEVPA